jgi:hypothetical protein
VIAIFDFLPAFCPQCGEEVLRRGVRALEDYFEHGTQRCGCGLMFQLAETGDIAYAAELSGGDLHRYAGAAGQTPPSPLNTA